MIKQAKQSEEANQWMFKKFFPKANYVARILEVDNSPSKAGNPMVKLTWEIVNCDPKRVGDELLAFDGVQFDAWYVLRVSDKDEDGNLVVNDAKSQRCFNAFDSLLRQAGMDTSAGWDDENPPSDYLKGKVFHLRLRGQADTMFNPPTQEELAEGKKTGSPLKDPITGKDVITYQIKVDEIYGLFQGEVRPF